jgi:hypothetical protein
MPVAALVVRSFSFSQNTANMTVVFFGLPVRIIA